ncbi:TPA: glycoside hydrolase family 3 C-terminal domain-containing protein, partial [Klebsiella pneumoniae]|nr:glycoside hydrolase family 3 C-terminal domain-containing protein [Klebsiella pneumoniae]
SGRPLWVNREINAADAFVAAWLPGSEGGGVADVLLRGPDGRMQHDFKGRLSFSWPRTATQYANNFGQKDYAPLFPFGFGLSYADKGDLAALPEVSGVTGNEGATGVFFARGDAGAGMALRLEDGAGQGMTVISVPDALADDRLKITGVDHLAQEDGRRLAWSGQGEAVAALQSHTPLDLQREANG